MKRLRITISGVLVFLCCMLHSCSGLFEDDYSIIGSWRLTQFDDYGEMFYYDLYDNYYLKINPDGSYEQYFSQPDYGRWSYNEATGEIVLSSIHGSDLYGRVVRLDQVLVIEYVYPNGYYEVEYYERF